MADIISNPHAAVHDAFITRELLEDEGPRPSLAVRRIPRTDYDAEFDKLIGFQEARFTQVDLRLMERGRHGFKPVHYRSLRELMAAPSTKRRIQERFSARNLKDINEQLKGWAASQKNSTQLRESFDFGLYPDEVGMTSPRNPSVFPLQDTVLPYAGSPQARQQLYSDVLATHQRAWEAAVRNPVGWRITQIIPQFVLGRGVVGLTKDKDHQKAWDEFYKRNKMRWRLRTIMRDLLIFGEQFLRYFRRPEGLVVRSVDPSTIWDVITNPEDIEDVHFYHQQYVIFNNSPVPGYMMPGSGTLVVRQIPAADIDHWKINSTGAEKRGRSLLYTVLGWLLRLKEFANDRVLLNKMRAMFALDVAVTGGPSEVAAAEALFVEPPGSGAAIIHNDSIKVEYKNANNNANEAKTDAEMLLKIIAVGVGVSEQFLGVSSAQTRAGALIQTEPDVKNFETYQQIVEEILTGADQRVAAQAKISKLSLAERPMEFTFPALAQEDRHAKLQDIAFAEAMDYFSKERAASMVAREFQVTTYDFKHEQQTIKVERATTPVIATSMQQVPKIQPEPLDAGGQPGLGPDLAPGAKTAPGEEPKQGDEPMEPAKRLAHAGAEMGFSAKQLSGRGMANTQATLDRSSFSKAGERNSIKKKRSAGAPLRASLEAPAPAHGWTDAARAAALAVRRSNAAKRRDALREADARRTAIPDPSAE